MSSKISKHYDEKYFHYQTSIGEFGGWVNQTKFTGYISSRADVLDFGCGEGFLLKEIQCNKKVG